MLLPETPIEKIPGISNYFSSRLKNLGLKTVYDLLRHFPVRYEDFKEIHEIADLVPGEDATIQGVVKKINSRKAWRRNMFITEAVIEDNSGKTTAVWFNQPYLQNQLKIGGVFNFSGRVRLSGEKIQLSAPNFELADKNDASENKHTARIVPIYPETRGLTSKGIRYFMSIVLKNIKLSPEPLPPQILKNQSFPNIQKALWDIHFPAEAEDAAIARKRFNFEDLFYLQIYNLEQKLELQKQTAPAIALNLDFIKQKLSNLPFELTDSQKKSLWEILQSLEKPSPMNRLLQGDVGSGKTIIAAIAAAAVARHKFQTAFMAPTEILTSQHYETVKKTFSDFEDGLILITSSEAKIFYGQGLEEKIKKDKALKLVEENKVKIIVGTHSLIQKNVKFQNLALVIIDEQHRFGVRQRAELVKSSSLPSSSSIPHFLSMSATPIPRTLSLTLWGDLDLSLITELPKNRKPIITKIVDPKNRPQAYAFIRGQIKNGRQAFVICPRIEETQKDTSIMQANNESFPRTSAYSPRESAVLTEVKTVKEEYEKLSKKIFPDLKIGMLHGKMKSKEKEETMRTFKNRAIDILVSTSVVEVGVDVPNAAIMMIEGAERFGLAQLYQFRGRVGRGENQSYCLLFTESFSSSVQERLAAIVEAKNGLELAEKDLQIRGPGEFLGEIQTGMPDLAMKALQHPELVKLARDLATIILREDRDLKKYPALKKQLLAFQKQIHWE